MEQLEVLQTVAEVATAFAGFAGVVVAVGSRRSDSWGDVNYRRLMLLLETSLSSVLFAFVPSLVLSALSDPAVGWRVCHGLVAAWHIGLIIRRSPANGGMRVDFPMPAAGVVALGLGGLTIISLLLSVTFGLWPRLGFPIYLAGLLWLLGICTMSFSVILIRTMRDD